MGRVERVFLGWRTPALPNAAEWLLADGADLSGVVCVLPGARAGRRLLELLVEGTERRGGLLRPPRIVTPGAIAEILLPPTPGERDASDAARRCAWLAALRAVPQERLGCLTPRAPEPDDMLAWMRLADRLDHLSVTLANEGLGVGEAAVSASRARGFVDAERWDLIADVARDAHARLSEQGLVAGAERRRERLARGDAPRPEGVRRVVLVGVAELAGLARRALDAAARAGPACTAIIFAPEEFTTGFDDAGCVSRHGVHLWRPRLKPGSIRFVETAADEADAALEALARQAGRLASVDVVIGTPDEDVARALERRAPLAGVRVRRAEGRAMRTAGAARALAAIASFLERPTARELGTLLREPEIERWMAAHLGSVRGREQEFWLAELDEIAERRLCDDVRVDDIAEAKLNAVHTGGLALLGGLRSPQRRPASAWAGEILAVLTRLYTGRTFRRDERSDRAVIASLEAVRAGVDALEALREHAAIDPLLTASESLRWVLDALAGARVPEESDPDAVEMLGWLELASDDAKAAVVTGMNEGLVPAPIAPDPLLPDGVRRALGISTSEDRAVRDAYLLALLCEGGREVTLIAARRSSDGDALRPSRVLFACEDDEAIRRVEAWAAGSEGGDEPPLRPTPAAHPLRVSLFAPMPRVERPAPTSMSVTSFRDYLRSPYLYFARHVLRITETDDRPREMSPPRFGDLVHQCLKQLGGLSRRGLSNEREVEALLAEALDRLVEEQFGSCPAAAVQVQAARARERLAGVARWQARWAGEGWAIAHTEWSPPGEGDERAALVVDGVPMALRGRIDRIDRHDDGRAALLDFKTGGSGEAPVKTHGGPGQWKDLQLPLYRYLASGVVGASKPILAYVLVPGAGEPVEIKEGGWDESALRSADDAASDVIRAVRKGDFYREGDAVGVTGVMGALLGSEFLRGGVGAGPGGEGGDSA